ncbi:MAG: hypothetical protein K2Z81_01465 [Cyanobacteria bacterium]|nr:hypothetical protein [Cyanobacteriota bacterium]
MFLLTPAAVHRQSNPDVVTIEFTHLASRLICLGMMPLLMSIVLDSYVVFNLVFKQSIWSVVLYGVLLLELTFCWIILPRIQRREQTNRHWDVR